MSLDVYIQPQPGPPWGGPGSEYVCSFEGGYRGANEGYFWFLFRLIFKDLAQQTGQRINLYDFAAFKSDTLDALEQSLIIARVQVTSQPDAWEVVTSTRIPRVPGEVRQTVHKQQMIVLLEKLEGAVCKTRETDAYLTFFGD
jgi:hypothetical protein